jgi:murein L,D-transpeptidase YafK
MRNQKVPKMTKRAKIPYFFSILLLFAFFVSLSPFAMRKSDKLHRLLVKKGERKLYVYQFENGKERLLKTYKIALGSSPTGTKRQQGDGATPEGDYYITHKNSRSKFYLSLGLSYPNTNDAIAGMKRGLITKTQYEAIINAINKKEKPPQNTKLGGDIFIHGGGTGSDWTLGCVALENDGIKELFDMLPVKTPVKIVP